MRVRFLLIGMVVLMCVFLPCTVIAGDFFDDFDDNDISDWEWIDKTDESFVENGEVYMETPNVGQRVILLSPVSVKNFTATFDVKIITFADGSLVFRYQNPNSYYTIVQGSGKVRFCKVNTPIKLVDKPHTRNQYVTYQVIAEDENIKVYVDDEDVLDIDDSSILEKGRIGLLINIDRRIDVAYSAYFDNFRVESEERLLTVDAAGGLTTTWGGIKGEY